jgi:hypothetical protein
MARSLAVGLGVAMVGAAFLAIVLVKLVVG